MTSDFEGARGWLDTASGPVHTYRLEWLAEQGIGDVHRLPNTVRILLENLLRRAGSRDVRRPRRAGAGGLARSRRATSRSCRPASSCRTSPACPPSSIWPPCAAPSRARAATPTDVNPAIPVDLIIDHSVQVDLFRAPEAYERNIAFEYRRNGERYTLLRWAQQAFKGLRVVPPGAGICHQVNLEHLGQVVSTREGEAFPDTLVGTDSHTTMINGLGVLGWGVGGIEAEAAMLGQPMFMPQPVVIGVRVTGALPAGTTATDLVLTLTEMLRAHGVVGKFVEFFGDGLSSLSIGGPRHALQHVPRVRGDRRATSPWTPRRCATSRSPAEATASTSWSATRRIRASSARRRPGARLQRGARAGAGLGRAVDGRPEAPAGPGRPARCLGRVRRGLPQIGRSPIRGPSRSARSWPRAARYATRRLPGGDGLTDVAVPLNHGAVRDGSVVIAAITSCTNTSNPSVMVAAGLLAKKAVEAGLTTQSWVKTSLAPGSRVVTDYLDRAGLTPYLEKLGFALVGYGCTTCIGNSGPLIEEVGTAVDDGDLNVVAVLSGNRNFEGRVHPQVRASLLASPPLCVAYALAGRVDLDLTTEPIGDGRRRPRLPARPLARCPGGRGVRRGAAHVGAVRRGVWAHLGGRRALARAALADRTHVRVGRRVHLRAGAAVLRRPRGGRSLR